MNSYAQLRQDNLSRPATKTYARTGPRSTPASPPSQQHFAVLQQQANLRPAVRHVAQLRQILNERRRAHAPVQMKGVAVKDDAGLEREADAVGKGASLAGGASLQTKGAGDSASVGRKSSVKPLPNSRVSAHASTQPVQRNGNGFDWFKNLFSKPASTPTPTPSPALSTIPKPSTSASVVMSPFFSSMMNTLKQSPTPSSSSSASSAPSQSKPLGLMPDFTSLLLPMMTTTHNVQSLTPKYPWMQKYLSPVAKPLIMSSASPMPWILPHLSTIMKLKQTAPQEPPPKRVEVVPMANSPLRNILSAVRLGLGFEDARASQLAQQQLLSHREEPELQHVFHVHSNASQTAHYAHTHDYLSAQQAQLDKVPKEQALTDPRQKAERDAILKKTSIVSTGGPQAATDLPDPNRSMLVRHQDVVPQLLTAALLKGKASSPNLQMFGPQFPPVPDEATFAGMEPEEIGAMLIKTMVTGVGEHAYTKYQKPAEGVTKQVVDSTSKSTRVHVGEGVFGTDAGAKKRAKEVEDALRK